MSDGQPQWGNWIAPAVGIVSVIACGFLGFQRSRRARRERKERERKLERERLIQRARENKTDEFLERRVKERERRATIRMSSSESQDGSPEEIFSRRNSLSHSTSTHDPPLHSNNSSALNTSSHLLPSSRLSSLEGDNYQNLSVASPACSTVPSGSDSAGLSPSGDSKLGRCSPRAAHALDHNVLTNPSVANSVNRQASESASEGLPQCDQGLGQAIDPQWPVTHSASGDPSFEHHLTNADPIDPRHLPAQTCTQSTAISERKAELLDVKHGAHRF